VSGQAQTNIDPPTQSGPAQPYVFGDWGSERTLYSRISGTLDQAYANPGLMPFGSEKALEVSHSVQVTRWFIVQPVFQYYFDTGANPLNRNSTLRGFRYDFFVRGA